MLCKFYFYQIFRKEARKEIDRERKREEGGREMAKKAEEMSACLNTYHDSFIVADYHKRASLAVIAQACRC